MGVVEREGRGGKESSEGGDQGTCLAADGSARHCKHTSLLKKAFALTATWSPVPAHRACPPHACPPELIVDGGGTALPMLRQQDPREYEVEEEEEQVEGF